MQEAVFNLAAPDSEVHWVEPTVQNIVCVKCGAWVPKLYERRHLEWHEWLRLVVDENQDLG